ncbi:MAG: type II secretion system F family protein [Synergistes sp.]|nr:type II secretion system F family protein [Synergistes sp.]
MEFYYEAKAKGGKKVGGIRCAERESDVVSWLKESGFIPLKIMEINERLYPSACQDSFCGPAAPGFLSFAPKVRLQDKLVFFRQLATMIESGIPVAGSLAVLSGQTYNKTFSAILARVYKDVSSGSALAAAMSEHPECFDSITIPLVRAGEESGDLAGSLGKIAKFLEDQNDLRKRIVTAMTYPAVVITVALAVLGIMIVVVIPQFDKAFSNLNVEMPLLTRAAFAIGRRMSSLWYAIPLAVAAVVLAISRLRRTRLMRLPVDSMLLKFPVFGDIMFKAAMTRSFRTMSSLLRSGLPVLSALELTSCISGNEKIKIDFLLIRDAASMGQPMNAAVRENKLFPDMVGHMIAVGEETGRTDEMLDKIADWYDAELSEKVKRLSSIIEPLMVVFVGTVVAFMAMAIFMPIISAIQLFL